MMKQLGKTLGVSMLVFCMLWAGVPSVHAVEAVWTLPAYEQPENLYDNPSDLQSLFITGGQLTGRDGDVALLDSYQGKTGALVETERTGM